MKKLFAALLAVMMVVSMATAVSAADTTTLTTTVPAATYTLNIPADQEIPFGATSTEIGVPTVSDSSGFAAGKNLLVTITYTDFKAEGVSTTIPITLSGVFYYSRATSGMEEKICAIGQGSGLVFEGLSSGEVHAKPYPNELGYSYSGYKMTDFYVKTISSDWGKALAGEYTATITFTAEVVVEE